jgi:hypothetical protein
MNVANSLTRLQFVVVLLIGLVVGQVGQMVYDDMRVPEVTKDMLPVRPFIYDGTGWSAVFNGIKVSNCAFVKGSTVAFVNRGGTWEKSGFDVFHDGERGISRPVGYHRFGVWRWNTDRDVTAVMLKITHYCGSKEVNTTLGPYLINLTTEDSYGIYY